MTHPTPKPDKEELRERLTPILNRIRYPHLYTESAKPTVADQYRVMYEAEENLLAIIAQERAEAVEQSIDGSREMLLRFYAGITGHELESVRDEYLGKPLPGADKHSVDNKLFAHVETAIHWHISTSRLSTLQTNKENQEHVS